MFCIDLKAFADRKHRYKQGDISPVGRRWFPPAGTWGHYFGSERLLQAFSLKISLQNGLGSRTLSSLGTNPTWGTGGFHGRSQVLIYKMAIFFFHNSMLLHYQILSWGQYLIPEVLDVNERCFASGYWGLNQQAQDSCWPLWGNTEDREWTELRSETKHEAEDGHASHKARSHILYSRGCIHHRLSPVWVDLLL